MYELRLKILKLFDKVKEKTSFCRSVVILYFGGRRAAHMRISRRHT